MNIEVKAPKNWIHGKSHNKLLKIISDFLEKICNSLGCNEVIFMTKEIKYDNVSKEKPIKIKASSCSQNTFNIAISTGNSNQACIGTIRFDRNIDIHCLRDAINLINWLFRRVDYSTLFFFVNRQKFV